MLSSLLLSLALALPGSQAAEGPFEQQVQLSSEAFLQSDTVDFVVADRSGERIASCASGGEVVLWDAESGAALARGQIDGIQRAVAMSFWGADKLLIGDLNEHIKVIAIQGSVLVELDPFKVGLGDLVDLGGSFALSPDEERILVWQRKGITSNAMLASLKPSEDGRIVRRALEISEYRIDQVVWREDGAEFVVVATNSMKSLGRAGTAEQPSTGVHVLARNGDERSHFVSQDLFIDHLAYGPHDGDDGLFVGGTREGVYLWDRIDGRRIMRVGELDFVITLDTAVGGTQLITSDNAGRIEEWTLALDDAPKLVVARRLARPLTQLWIDGSEHAVGCQGRRVRRWTVDGMHPEPNIVGHSGQLVTLETRGDALLSVAMDGSVALRNLADGSAVGMQTVHDGIVFGASLAPDATQVATCGQDSTVRIWSLADDETFGQLVRQLGGRSVAAFTDVAFSPKGDQLAAVTADGILWIWNTADGALVRTFEGLKGLKFKLAYSNDGEFLAMAAGSLRVWRTSDWEMQGFVETFGAPVTALAFHPESRTVAIGLANRLIVMVDAGTGQELHRSQPLMGRVAALSFTKVGLAATSSLEGGIRLFSDELEPVGFVENRRPNALAALAVAGERLIAGDISGRIDLWK